MIEPEDFIVSGNLSIQNQRVIDVPGAFGQAKADIIAVRLSQLESKPVIGAYDAYHLQQIHAHIFQDLFPWAGQFRKPESPSLTSSLDTLFDRLARENRLKNLDRDTWLKRSTEYLNELSVIEPFLSGNELASLEFFRQLGSENNMTLRLVNGMSEPNLDEQQLQLQRAQSNNLRRVLMLAIDPYSTIRSTRDARTQNTLELITPT